MPTPLRNDTRKACQLTDRTLAVIDGNSLLHRAFHALPPTMTAPDGRPTNAVFGFLQMLLKLVADIAPDSVIVAFDRGKPAFRTEALKAYKAHRPPTAAELRVQFPMVKEVLEAMAVPVVEVEGWEADDLLGTLAERAKATGALVLLVTGDRDALQLVDERVRVVSTRKGLTDIVVYDRDGVIGKTGVPPELIPDYLGLKGDASDNIPGVPGVGEKTAARLIAEHGSLEAVLDAAPSIKGKLGENLREHADAARVSRLVATICRDVPLEADLGIGWGAWDPETLRSAFGALRFTSLVGKVLASATRAVPDAPPGPFVADPLSGGAPEGAWEIARGEDAARLAAHWAGSGHGWIGASPDESGAGSLFCETSGIALARDGQVAVLEGDAAATALSGALRDHMVAAADVKALVRGLHVDDGLMEPERLFDCGIAAYLLESNRSSYDVDGLLADYAGAAMPSSDDPAASEAQAVASLVPSLEERLRSDGSHDVFSRVEMPLVPVLVRMERAGVAVDTGVLATLSEETGEGIDRLAGEIFDLAGCEFTIDSPKQLGEVLFDKLGLPRGRRTKTGWSTDASVLGELGTSFPIAGKVLDYRELRKLKSTYVDALPRLVGDDGRVHTTFNQTVAATGRLSSSNPNLQNIPVRTALGRRIRAAFVPTRPGDVILSADYSQIELRILAHLSGDQGLIGAFVEGADLHAATASRVFGVPPGEVDPEQRRRAKAVNFGIVYGISAHGLAESLGIERAEAQAMIDRYYEAYPGVREFLVETVASARRDGHASTLLGRKRRIPELGSSNHNVRAFGERTAMNHPMQGTAADIVKLAMVDVDRLLAGGAWRAAMVLQVHDELVFECPEREAEALAASVREAMERVVELAVPLAVDVAWGPDWASAK